MHVFQVASFTGAWIETPTTTSFLYRKLVASFTGAWIETYIGQISEKYILVASFTGAWIETFNPCLTMCKLGRILYGCDTFLFQSVQIIIVSIYLVSSFHY